MMSEKQFEALIQKLNALIKLTALNVLKNKPKKEQIKILADVGFDRQEIASIVKTTPLTVSVTLSQMKKKKAKKRKPKRTEGVLPAEN